MTADEVSLAKSSNLAVQMNLKGLMKISINHEAKLLPICSTICSIFQDRIAQRYQGCYQFKKQQEL